MKSQNFPLFFQSQLNDKRTRYKKRDKDSKMKLQEDKKKLRINWKRSVKKGKSTAEASPRRKPGFN